MKYLKQFMVIMVFSLIGEILNLLIPLPVPASIYGMVLLFLALLSGVVKLSQVEGAADFCLAIMPVFFVGPTMRLMAEYKVITGFLVPFLVIGVLSTLAALLSCGLTAQFVIRRQRREASPQPDGASSWSDGAGENPVAQDGAGSEADHE